MSLESDIMNIQIDESKLQYAVDFSVAGSPTLIAVNAYKLSHRDVRHAAAELACSYESKFSTIITENERAKRCLDELNACCSELSEHENQWYIDKAMRTDYAVDAVEYPGTEINKADAGMFFLAGIEYALSEMKKSWSRKRKERPGE